MWATTPSPPITTWAELRISDREVLNRTEVAALLTLDPRTVDHAVEDGTIPAVHIGQADVSAVARQLRG